MGYDVGGSIGYGFPIPEKKFSEENKPEGMEFVFAGDVETEVFLCLKQSIQGSSIETVTKLDLSKLVVTPEQHQQVLEAANKFKIAKSKIAWWLLASGG